MVCSRVQGSRRRPWILGAFLAVLHILQCSACCLTSISTCHRGKPLGFFTVNVIMNVHVAELVARWKVRLQTVYHSLNQFYF
jgi:hypothetical protein